MLKDRIENKNITNGDPIAPAVRIMATGFVSPSETPIVTAGAAAIWARGGPRSFIEQEVCRYGANSTLILPTDDRPTPPAEMYRNVDERVAVAADTKAAKAKALEALVAAEQAYAKKPNERTRDAWREAQEAWRLADDVAHRAHSAVIRAQLDIDAWRRAQSLAAIPVRPPKSKK